MRRTRFGLGCSTCVGWLLVMAVAQVGWSFSQKRAPRSAIRHPYPPLPYGVVNTLQAVGDSAGDVMAVTALLNDTMVPVKRKRRRKAALLENEHGETEAQQLPSTEESVDGTAESTTTRPKRRKRHKASAALDYYWSNAADEFSLEHCNHDESQARSVRFQVRGSPRPLRRHRTARGFMYNPSSLYQESFRKIAHKLVWPEIESELECHEPLFSEDDQLAMTLVFHMKRAKKHFVSSKPGPGRLRNQAPPRLGPSRADVDNLAKFVLDSLNGLLYVDDRQVSSIQATKLLHDDGECEGCTEVFLYKMTDDDLDVLLQHARYPQAAK